MIILNHKTTDGLILLNLDKEARDFLKAMLHRAESDIAASLEEAAYNPGLYDDGDINDMEADAARCLAFISKL